MKKLLAVLTIGILGIAGISVASAGFHHGMMNGNYGMGGGCMMGGYISSLELTDEQKVYFETHRALMEKLRNGGTLTSEEETTLTEARGNMGVGMYMGGRGGMGRGIGMGGMYGMGNMTEQEITAFNSMTNDEKKVYFESKMTEQRTRMETQESMIDKLLNGGTLTTEEETLKQEMIEMRKNRRAQFNITE